MARTLWPSGERRGLARGGTAVQTPDEPGVQTGMLESAPHLDAAGPRSALCKLYVGRLALPVLHFRPRF